MLTVNITDITDNQYTMKMIENDNVLCVGQMTIADECTIDYISETDFTIGFGMGKALLNVADNRKVKTVVCRNKELFKLMERLEFVKEGNCMTLNLEDYFSAGCH